MNLRSIFDTDDTLPSEWLIERMRIQRDRLLSESDWALIPDAPTDKEAWAVYRQALRDFPATWEPSEIADFPVSPDHVETVQTPVADEPVVDLVEGEQP
jgi:hypothetical protein